MPDVVSALLPRVRYRALLTMYLSLTLSSDKERALD